MHFLKVHFSGFAAQNRSDKMAILGRICHFYTVNTQKDPVNEMNKGTEVLNLRNIFFLSPDTQTHPKYFSSSESIFFTRTAHS